MELAAPLPGTLWIELTSKCPLDCVFCSRKSVRGVGEHMDFELYGSILSQLDRPQIIRLNYSGESMHHPHLADAIRLAKQTGAVTELVTALVSAPYSAIDAIVDAGLDRLSVSVHTLEEGQFPAIYGLGTAAALRKRIAHLLTYRGSRPVPVLDFAFVATDENLGQLSAVAAFAREVGAAAVSVHPVIQRDGIQSKCDLVSVLKAAEGIAVVARPPADPPPAPDGGITTCEQNPWETMHVLADGTVVVCEVQDHAPMGNLACASLAAVWHGEPYREFRRAYLGGRHPACANCCWRQTATAKARPLVRGWYPRAPGDAQWSQSGAAMVVAVPDAARGVRVGGVLPPQGELTTTIADAAAHVVNPGPTPLPFEQTVHDVPPGDRVIRFEAPRPYAAPGDARMLGFALSSITFAYDARRVRGVHRLIDLLGRIPPRRRNPALPLPRQTGVSIVVPARATPDLLRDSLQAAEVARAAMNEPSEIVVVYSGTQVTPRELCNGTWLVSAKPLDYVAAVERGVARARYPWVYLLNSDMHLESGALAEVIKHRGPKTFAVASRIRMLDGSAQETNWTALRLAAGDAAQIVELDPANLGQARHGLYAGGGSSLFRRELLRRYLRASRAYAPFYWEDVEWGARAWFDGLECVFAPQSIAIHARRATIARFYERAEVDRIFERNRLLFHLRNLEGLTGLRERLLELDAKSWRELTHPRMLAGLVRARWNSGDYATLSNLVA